MKKIKVISILGSSLDMCVITTLYETLEELKHHHPSDSSNRSADYYWNIYKCGDERGVIITPSGRYVFVGRCDMFEVIEEKVKNIKKKGKREKIIDTIMDINPQLAIGGSYALKLQDVDLGRGAGDLDFSVEDIKNIKIPLSWVESKDYQSKNCNCIKSYIVNGVKVDFLRRGKFDNIITHKGRLTVDVKSIVEWKYSIIDEFLKSKPDYSYYLKHFKDIKTIEA